MSIGLRLFKWGGGSWHFLTSIFVHRTVVNTVAKYDLPFNMKKPMILGLLWDCLKWRQSCLLTNARLPEWNSCQTLNTWSMSNSNDPWLPCAQDPMKNLKFRIGHASLILNQFIIVKVLIYQIFWDCFVHFCHGSKPNQKHTIVSPKLFRKSQY